MRHGSSSVGTAKLSAKKLATLGVIALAVTPSEKPPTEFRIFKAGWNDTENGRFLFDEKAAQAVMAAYSKWAVDVAIDLEHQMLDDEPSPDPTSKDARGWCKLELRDTEAGFELWAVDVKWTEDGAARLTGKRQRYISPAFAFDKKTKRVIQIVNVAITAIPATHGAQELMAASRASDMRKLSAGPSFADVAGAIHDALKARMPSAPPDYLSPYVVDVFDASCVFQVGATYYEAPYTYANGAVTLGEPVQVTRSYTPAASAPAETSTPETNAAEKPGVATMKMKIEQFLKICKALGIEVDKTSVEQAMAQIRGDEESGDSAEAGDGGGEPPSDEEKAAIAASVAAGRLAMETTGKATVSEAMAELTRRSKVATEVEEERAKLSKDRAKLELDERTTIVKSLQALGVETPATSGLASGKLCDRLLKEPIDELRARHAAIAAAKGVKAAATSPGVQPPVGQPSGEPGGRIVTTRRGETTELSARTLAIIAESGKTGAELEADIQSYAENKIAMLRARGEQPTV